MIENLDSEGKKVYTLSQEEYENITKELENEKTAKSNLVEEVKDLRSKKQLTEAEKTQLEDKLKQLEAANGGPQDVSKIIEEEFSKRERATVEETKRAAIDAFKARHKEFHDANDAAGIKYQVFEKELARFNLNGLRTEAEFAQAFEDALALMNREKKTEKVIPSPYSSTAPTGGSVTVVEEGSDLTDKEKKFIQTSFGGDAKKYLELKAKRPDYMASLLAHVR